MKEPKRVFTASNDFMAAFDADYEAPKAPPKKKVKQVDPPIMSMGPDFPERRPSIDEKQKQPSGPYQPTEEDLNRLRESRQMSILRTTPLTKEEKKLRKIRFDDNLVQTKFFEVEAGERGKLT